ncbi:MAG: EAL domain-containing protein, partial [Psychromonas sp.]
SIDTTDLFSFRAILGKLFLTSNIIIFAVIILLSFLLGYIIDRLMFVDSQLELTTKIADSTSDAVVITDRNTRITYANKAYEEATGYPIEEIIGLKTSYFKSDKQDKAFYQKMWQDINETNHWEGMLWDRKKDGLLCPKKLKIIAIRDKKNKEVDKYIGIFTDLSANKMKSDTFEMLKHEDGQIIIPNENMMIDLLNQSIKNKDFSFTIVYLAIENFNRIASLFDEDSHYVAKIFISLIRPFLQEGDVVAQTGRNLFAVIIGMKHIQDGPEKFVKNFHKELSKVINIDGRDLFFKTRVGVSYWPQDTNDIKKLLLNSMIALEWTTRRRESEIAFFNEQMIAELNQANEIEGQLRKAVENNELSMVYQPQTDIDSGNMIGMEALVRWHNAVLGNVSPAVFIPIAEKSHLMIDIGNWIIQAVCEDLNKIKKHCCITERNLRCAINISAIQMAEFDFANKFFACVDANNIQSHEIEFEITESSLLTNEKKSIEILKAIREKGITVAIDDFGTGYSSLSYLHTLPIDKIKIDRSFIKNYPDNDDGTLVKILVEMSKTLQMKVLTEGAETKEQVDYLRGIGCDYIQG